MDLIEKIPKYKEDTTLKLKVVSTIDGSDEYLKHCVKLVSNYYKKEEQAILLDKKWYPLNSGSIFYNHESKKHELRKKGLVICSGIVGHKDGQFLRGEYTMNPFNNCSVWHIQDGAKKKEECMDYKILKNLGFVEHVNQNIWATDDFFVNTVFTEDELNCIPKRIRTNLLNLYGCSKTDFLTPKEYTFNQNAYNVEDDFAFEKRKKMYEEFTVDYSKDVRRAARLIGDLTFGIEIEVKKGTLPENLMNQLGVIICKDGSIGYTPEFVTVPLQGAKGLQTTQNLFMELNKRCTTDHSCSLHCHIGSIRKDREFIVALFKLYSDVQKSLHQMLPFYKTDPREVKEKNYCAFLDKGLVTRHLNKGQPYKEEVNAAYCAIQTWILEGRHGDRDFNRKNHAHPNGREKWNRHSRYASINFMNLFTSKRQTVEFRAHHAVLSPIKAVNWFFICVAIIKYAETHSAAIIKSKEVYKLEDVIDYYKTVSKTSFAEGVSEYLKAYVSSRQSFFLEKMREGDKVVVEDYKETDYAFSFNGKTSVF